MADNVPDTPGSYMRYLDMTCAYYLSQGYGEPYPRAYSASAPFMPLTKPLSGAAVACVRRAPAPEVDGRL